MSRLSEELRRLGTAVRSVDAQVTVVLLGAALLVIFQETIGTRSFFRKNVAGMLGTGSSPLDPWAWRFVIQGVLGFVTPVLLLTAVFRRRPSAIGLGLGDVRFALLVAALYVPVVIVGTWVLSDLPSFQSKYPHLQAAALDWKLFASYQLLFLFYWVGWEYLWRGFVLFGTAHVFGLYAILIQAMPFAILHAGKPFPEALLSIVGGVALGALVWRCRSFWIAVPIHFVQMLVLDLWCSLRLRTGASGIGLDALAATLGI